MKKFTKLVFGIGLIIVAVCLSAFSSRTSTHTSIYDFKLKTLDGQEITLAKFKGKKILIVNVASECGYTPQYKNLQALSEQYKDKLVVVGFPANNFGGQE